MAIASFSAVALMAIAENDYCHIFCGGPNGPNGDYGEMAIATFSAVALTSVIA